MDRITKNKKAIFEALAKDIEGGYMDYFERVDGKSCIVQPAWKDKSFLTHIGEFHGWDWQYIPVRLDKKRAKPKRLELLADGITVFFMDGHITLAECIKDLKKDME